MEGIARERIDDEEVVRELEERVARAVANEDLRVLINEACFFEEKRLRGAKDADDRAYLELLREARRAAARAPRLTLDAIVRNLARHYAREIHGHFDVNVYKNATRFAPPALSVLLRRQKPWQILQKGSLDLSAAIRPTGDIEIVDRLVERGTVVLVPTHISNLDSPVIGFALHSANLPPMIYGAGINLFTNWLLSYFMDHLGAYKVDRLKHHTLYKVCLKEYSALAIRRRWHSLFFPGGTRSRSGAVEPKLKKGLMGTGLEAFKENLRQGRDKPRVFFVPATLNYHLVLEAETLIDDALKAEGKSRYIITDDEFSRPDKVVSFAWNMLGMSNPIEVRFSRPLDPFGNPVDADGNSLDPEGRPFDPAGYVMRNGDVVDDDQRDRVYTDRLADAIQRAFFADTVLFDTHVAAAAVHRRLEARYPDLDLFRRLLLTSAERSVPIDEVDGEIALLCRELRELADQRGVRLGSIVAGGTPAEIRDAAIEHFAKYHTRRAMRIDGGDVYVDDPRLALYYANRLRGYPLSSPRAEVPR